MTMSKIKSRWPLAIIFAYFNKAVIAQKTIRHWPKQPKLSTKSAWSQFIQICSEHFERFLTKRLLDKCFLPAHVACSPTSIMVLLAFLHNLQECCHGLMTDIILIVKSSDLLMHWHGMNKHAIVACASFTPKCGQKVLHTIAHCNTAKTKLN